MQNMLLRSPNAQVVAGDIFATCNCLESHEARKTLSRFSNILAVTFKLCTNPMPTAADHLTFKSRATLKAHIPNARRSLCAISRAFVLWRFSYAGPRMRGQVRDGAGIRKPSQERS
jgi:hypothetical protein